MLLRLASVAAALIGAGQEPAPEADKTVPPEQVRISRPAEAARPDCAVAPAEPGHRLMVIGHYEGSALSSVWIEDSREVVHVADIRVEPGPAIHLVITAYGRTLYRFTGDTPRIARLTLMGRSAAGAIGVPGNRIEHRPGCLAYGLFGEGASRSGAEAIEALFRRPPDLTGYTYDVWRARIGEAVTFTPERLRRSPGADAETQELYSFHPGDPVSIDPAEIHSAVATGRYRVLPQEAGIRQLVMSGALVRATEADARRWEMRARAAGTRGRGIHGSAYGIYRVTRPIEIPSGLCGAHSVSLYVASRDWISGDPCHSTLYFDDGTGTGPTLR